MSDNAYFVFFFLILICGAGLIFTFSPTYYSFTISDLNGDTIKLRINANNEFWDDIQNLYANGSKRWIGGELQESSNSWGFTFKPESIRVALIVAETYQTNLQFIQGSLQYWLDLGTCYVWSSVIDV